MIRMYLILYDKSKMKMGSQPEIGCYFIEAICFHD